MRCLGRLLLITSVLVFSLIGRNTLAAFPSVAGMRYTAVALPITGSLSTYYINDRGTVAYGTKVIYTRDSSGNPILSTGSMPIEQIPSEFTVNGQHCYVLNSRGINNYDEVLLVVAGCIGAASYRHGTFNLVTTAPVGDPNPTALNDDGWFVGSFSGGASVAYTFAKLSDQVTTFYASGFPRSVNNGGFLGSGRELVDLVAWSTDPSVDAFRALPSSLRDAYAYNDFNVAVGPDYIYDYNHDQTYYSGSSWPMAPYEIQGVFDINNHGIAVGFIRTADGSPYARIRSRNEEINLESLILNPEVLPKGGHLSSASGINNRDDIIAQYATAKFILFSQTPFTCSMDWNGDGEVGNDELTLLMRRFGKAGPIADINNDGIVNMADLTLLLHKWGRCRN